jgi:RpiR family carbohydrate utilization transcriptional regulator
MTTYLPLDQARFETTMLSRISAALMSLSPAEQRVRRLVLCDPMNFRSLPVSELTELAEVSKPTVVRFSRSMCYDGTLLL